MSIEADISKMKVAESGFGCAVPSQAEADPATHALVRQTCKQFPLLALRIAIVDINWTVSLGVLMMYIGSDLGRLCASKTPHRGREGWSHPTSSARAVSGEPKPPAS